MSRSRGCMPHGSWLRREGIGIWILLRAEPSTRRAQAARKSYLTSVALLVELASLQTAFLTLDEAIKTTNRRVNALDSVVKPMLENTIAYIKVCRRKHFPCVVGFQVLARPGRWALGDGAQRCFLHSALPFS